MSPRFPIPRAGGYAAQTISLSVAVDKPFGAFDPVEVEYFAGDRSIGKSTAAPDYRVDWDISGWVAPTYDEQTVNITLKAEASDRYLTERRVASPLVAITVKYGAIPPLPPTPTPTVIDTVTEPFIKNWPLVILLLMAFFGLLVLLLLGLKLKSDLGKKVASRATGVVKGVTRALQPLGGGPQAPGKLVIVHGANVGKEFRITGQVVKVGREPQFCDFALYDEFVSNPHFSVYYDNQGFFIQDDGSRNRTRLNGQVIPQNQRIPLLPDSMIEVGSTRLQFKRLGAATRHLGSDSEVRRPDQSQPGAARWDDPTQVSLSSRDGGLQATRPQNRRPT